MLTWSAKDPNEVLDYEIDWTTLLGTDNISASTWEVVSGVGLVMDSNTFSTKKTTLWLSAGVVGTTYQLTNHITTTGGRQRDQSVKLKIKAK